MEKLAPPASQLFTTNYNNFQIIFTSENNPEVGVNHFSHDK